MKWLILIGMPLNVLAFALLPFIDFVFPWEHALTEIEKSYGEQFRVCVGLTSSYQDDGYLETVEKSRSYILIPALFSSPELVSFSEITENGNVSYSKFSSVGSLLFTILFLIAMILGSWKFSFPAFKKLNRSRGGQKSSSEGP